MASQRLYFVRRPNEERWDYAINNLRSWVWVMGVANPDRDIGSYEKNGCLFMLGDDRDHEMFMKTLAENNPGCSVECYSLQSSAQAVVGPVVMKEVSADGVLPTAGVEF